MNRSRSHRLLISAAAGVLLVLGAASPANAAPRHAEDAPAASLTASYGEGAHCSVNLDTGVRVCADSQAELSNAVYEATGEALLFDADTTAESPTETRMATTTAATYALGTIYSYPNYGGRSYTATSSYTCSQGLAFTYSDLGAIGWNDDIDSFKSYNGCRTKLWENRGFSGASYGYYSYDNDLGSWRNRASSIRWD